MVLIILERICFAKYTGYGFFGKTKDTAQKLWFEYGVNTVNNAVLRNDK